MPNKPKLQAQLCKGASAKTQNKCPLLLQADKDNRVIDDFFNNLSHYLPTNDLP